MTAGKLFLKSDFVDNVELCPGFPPGHPALV